MPGPVSDSYRGPRDFTVNYFSRIEHGYGNVIFPARYPKRNGKFPKTHPCHDNPEPTVFSRESQPKSDDALGQFRARGYMASCFPEGDGFAFDPPDGKTTPDIVRDIEECFGWVVKVKRA